MLACLALLLMFFDLSEPPSNLPALIAQLGSRSFREREAASKAIAALGTCARLALGRAAVEGDPETQSRARRLLEALWDVPGPCAWLDMTSWPKPMQPWQLEYLNRARGCTLASGPLWQEYQVATAFWLKDLKRLGIAERWIRGILAQMREREGEYRRRHGMPGVVANY